MILRKGTVPATEARASYPAPFTLPAGRMRWEKLSDAAGLTQFGATFETLDPGAESSLLHWHETEDEFLYLLEGTLTVIEGDTVSTLHPGDAAAWKAGEQVGHTIRNDGTEPCRYLMVGTRSDDDICHYPGRDIVATPSGYTHLDGTPYPKPRK